MEKQNFLEKLNSSLRQIPLLQQGQHLLVGVSGGADSLALLLGLVSLGSYRLSVGHLDHCLRDDSASDLEFVRSLSASLRIPFYGEKADVRGRAQRENLSIEEAARSERMDFLFRLKEELGASWILLGHTADDQVETILIRLFSGSGSSGLKGIPLYDAQRRVIHPILNMKHEETVAFCGQMGVSFRQDYTNFLPSNPRNAIRNNILPEIIKFFPTAKKGILRSSAILSAEDEYLEEFTTYLYNRFVLEKGEALLIKRGLNELPLALVRRVIQKALILEKNKATYYEIEALRGLLNKEVGSSFFSPGIYAERIYEGIAIGKAKDQESENFLDWEVGVKPPQILRLPWGDQVTIRWVSPQEVFFRPEVSYLDPQEEETFFLRTWHPGDRFLPLGQEFPKKLQDFFVDRKISRQERRRAPLFLVGDEIACIIGKEVGEKFKVTPQSTHILELKIEKREE